MRIGTFNNGKYLSKSKPKSVVSSEKADIYVEKTFLILTLLYACCSLFALTFSPPNLQLKPTYRLEVYTPLQTFQQIPSSYTSPVVSLNIIQVSLNCDPGGDVPLHTFPGTSSWLTRRDRNRLAHLTYGNRNHRGKGVTCMYWNKGPSALHNKMLEIETIIDKHKPHILGLGEANFRGDHDIDSVQVPGYTLHIPSIVQRPGQAMARIVVYTHHLLRVKRRWDLENENVAAIWLECGLPHQRGFLVCMGYRQWRLLGQTDSTSSTVAAQLIRWEMFLDNWEKALKEEKEVIVALDANIDHLTWKIQDSLPSHSSSVRLKSLIDALFTRIIPLGVTQLVTGATRMERGQPKTGLDHLYTNKVEKLSSVQTFLTGTSDHKLLKVVRFTKSFKHLPRYVKKRTFKCFNEEEFRNSLIESGLDEVLNCTDVNLAAEILTTKLSEILDIMAPVKKFQTRTNYAPWMSKETKLLKEKKRSGSQESHRYRST